MTHRNHAANTPEDHARHELEWLHRARAEGELLRAVESRVKRQRMRRLAAGSALLMLLLVGSIVIPSHRSAFENREPAVVPPAATTAIVSRPARQTLPDGSTVELNGEARISVDYGAAVRRITLISGEAHFEVAPNEDRPFIVQAGRVEVRAVGTAFSVQFAPAAVEILVTEGTVRVTGERGAENALAHPPVSGETAALVGAGRRCVVDADNIPRVQDISAIDAGERLAWRIPQLEFSRTSLPEVVALMNQHAATTRTAPFEIADAELTTIKLSGFLRADNTEGLLRLLQNNFHVTAERAPEKIILRKQR